MTHDELGSVWVISPQKATCLKKLEMVFQDILLGNNVPSFALRLTKPSPVHGVSPDAIILRKFFEKIRVVLAVVPESRQVEKKGIGATLSLLAVGGHLETLIVYAFYQKVIVVVHWREALTH